MTRYSFKLQATTTMTRDSLIDHLTGSGADAYPWWRTVEVTDDGCLLLEADSETDIDGTEPPVSKLLTMDEVVDGIQTMLDSPSCPRIVTEALQHDDVDADAADLILQNLLFGMPIYG